MDVLPMNEDVAEFVNAGVCGFLLKDATFEEFVGTIRLVAAGDEVLPPRMTESLFSQIGRAADGTAYTFADRRVLPSRQRRLTGRYLERRTHSFIRSCDG